MKDTVVTVRMPVSLIKALDEEVAEGHYLDFSEAVRSIIRQRYLGAYSLDQITDRQKSIDEKEGTP